MVTLAAGSEFGVRIIHSMPCYVPIGILYGLRHSEQPATLEDLKTYLKFSFSFAESKELAYLDNKFAINNPYLKHY